VNLAHPERPQLRLDAEQYNYLLEEIAGEYFPRIRYWAK